MVEAMWAWAEANQPIAMTPFLLAGATAPVSVAAGLSLQVAEALSGVAIAQAIRPGVGCFFGSFFSGVDMRSGGPSLGMPESVLGSLAGGQLARRYGLPFRGGGGLTSANALDAQAATESAMSLWGTYLVGLRPRAARGRLARGRSDVLVREVRARPRGAAHVREPARGSRRRQRDARARDDPRGGAGRASSSPPTTRSSTSASGSS